MGLDNNKDADEMILEPDDPIASLLKSQKEETKRLAAKFELLKNSKEYQAELNFLKKTVHDLIVTLRLSSLASTRIPGFIDNSMLFFYFDDIVEAALAAMLAIENGAVNPARRELRFMLEVAVNATFVDEIKGSAPFVDKAKFFKSKRVKKKNVDNVFELPLRLLPSHREVFRNVVRNAWINASNYVHPTKRRMQEKISQRAQGITIGFETIGPSTTGELLVDALDQSDDWAFRNSEILAIVDSQFDYKHERQHCLQEHVARRESRIKYHAPRVNG